MGFAEHDLFDRTHIVSTLSSQVGVMENQSQGFTPVVEERRQQTAPDSQKMVDCEHAYRACRNL